MSNHSSERQSMHEEIQNPKATLPPVPLPDNKIPSHHRSFLLYILLVVTFCAIAIGGYFSYKFIMAKIYDFQADNYFVIRDYKTAQELLRKSQALWNTADKDKQLKIINEKLTAQSSRETQTPITITKVTATPTLIPLLSPISSVTLPTKTFKKQTISYAIAYYDLDKASNKALVKSGAVDPSKQNTIEKILVQLRVSPAFINQYAIIFTKIFDYGGQAIGILRHGKQQLISNLKNDNHGTASYYNKYIVLDSSMSGGELEAVFTHELGHIVEHYLSADEFKAFMQRRNIPNDIVESWYIFINNGRQGAPPLKIGDWAAKPTEDFADVFKVSYATNTPGGNWQIRTNYGPVTSEQLRWFKETVSAKFQY